jgi:hypothetical protein
MTCDRNGCSGEAEYRVFWPDAPPATLCSGHTLMAINAGQQAGVRVTSVALGSVFENLLLWRMVRANERMDARER